MKHPTFIEYDGYWARHDAHGCTTGVFVLDESECNGGYDGEPERDLTFGGVNIFTGVRLEMITAESLNRPTHDDLQIALTHLCNTLDIEEPKLAKQQAVVTELQEMIVDVETLLEQAEWLVRVNSDTEFRITGSRHPQHGYALFTIENIDPRVAVTVLEDVNWDTAFSFIKEYIANADEWIADQMRSVLPPL